MKSIYYFDEENGVSEVTFIEKNGRRYVGYACCHEKDKDMMSEKTGMFIAEQRAVMDYLREFRDTDIKPKLQILEHIYNSFQQSKNFNEKSYESRLLRRQIRLLKNDLTTINEDLTERKENLKDFLEEKDKFYNRIRANRKEDAVDE